MTTRRNGVDTTMRHEFGVNVRSLPALILGTLGVDEQDRDGPRTSWEETLLAEHAFLRDNDGSVVDDDPDAREDWTDAHWRRCK